MAPASLTRLNAVSIPSFICRPSSLAEPEKGATIPKRISLVLMPRALVDADGAACVPVEVVAAMVVGAAACVAAAAGGAAGGGGAAAGTGCAGAATGGLGAGAAMAADGPITPDSEGPASDCSSSVSCRSADLQSVRPAVTALRPSPI